MGNDDQILVEIELKWTEIVLGAVRHVLSWRERPARRARRQAALLIGLDLACALLAFSRLRAGGGSI